MKNLKSFLVIVLTTAAFSHVGFASEECETPVVTRYANTDRASTSFYEIDRNHFQPGLRQFEPTILASISKILVTHWALRTYPDALKTQFALQIFPNKLANGHYHVHISGYHYPTFDQKKLDAIFKMLRSKGISPIDELSFDEFTKYIPDWADRVAILGDLPLDYPSRSNIVANMSAYKRAANSPTFERFRIINYRDAASLRNRKGRILTYSASLVSILHDMNEQSNNHLANQLFQYLGGTSAYAAFAWKTFVCADAKACDPGSIVMYNGSGNPVVEEGPGQMPTTFGHYVLTKGKKQYNRAPGVVITQALAEIYAYVKANKFKLSDIMSVADPEDKNHLTNRYASKCYFRNNIAAKTGTVFSAINLAGFVSTKVKGPIAFYINIATRGESEYGGALAQIQSYLTGIIGRLGEGVPFD